MSLLYLAKDLKYIDKIKINGLLSDCMVLSKGISKLITYLDSTTSNLYPANLKLNFEE